MFFVDVAVAKPRSSRNSSIGARVSCTACSPLYLLAPLMSRLLSKFQPHHPA